MLGISERAQFETGAARRPSGTRRILVYCADDRCSHSIAMSADRWPDDVRLSDIEPRFVCTAFGKRGADVRPDWLSDQTPKSGTDLTWLEPNQVFQS